ncbi:c-type cytochrome [Flavimarina sp. Hel_I_48]|uniref:c-type cytochrome n=1 Tax=Flavimarina sp. Hel_I_48 TaxID=1392488 RepID=UPI0004DF7BE2|nr:cytochrome c [Flavimarina sp. Hel_I_48]
MKYVLKPLLFIATLAILSCGNSGDNKENKQIKLRNREEPASNKEAGAPASSTADPKSKGIGPVKDVKLNASIDQSMAKTGKELFTNDCTACHRTDAKFIGPALKGVLDRRSPEWVMNMILNPQVMIKEDPTAKELLNKFNGAQMIDQNLTEEEARAILEYFRTL